VTEFLACRYAVASIHVTYVRTRAMLVHLACTADAGSGYVLLRLRVSPTASGYRLRAKKTRYFSVKRQKKMMLQHML
jgi:hypothetical protein